MRSYSSLSTDVKLSWRQCTKRVSSSSSSSSSQPIRRRRPDTTASVTKFCQRVVNFVTLNRAPHSLSRSVVEWWLIHCEILFVRSHLHDTTGCQTVKQQVVCLHDLNVLMLGCMNETGWIHTTGWRTGWMFGYTIQPVVQPVVKPVWQPVVGYIV